MSDEERNYNLLAYSALKQRGLRLDELYGKCFDGLGTENGFAYEAVKKLMEENDRAIKFFFEKASGK